MKEWERSKEGGKELQRKKMNSFSRWSRKIEMKQGSVHVYTVQLDLTTHISFQQSLKIHIPVAKKAHPAFPP